MATTIQKKPAAVIDQGGNYIINVVLTSTTTVPGFAMPTVADTNTFDLGQVSSSTVAQTASKSSFKNEAGDTVASSFQYDLITTGVLMQSDADLLNYLGAMVKGKSILQIKHTGTVNGLDQWHFQIGQVTPQFAVSRPGGTTALNYEHTGYDLTSDFTISAADLLAIASTLSISTTSFFPTTTVTIPATDNFKIVEVA